MKRRILLLAVLAAGWATTAWCDNSGEQVVETFYGTKARNSSINPCKGPTTRVCGKRVTNTTNGTVTTIDASGNIIYQWEIPVYDAGDDDLIDQIDGSFIVVGGDD